jgi:hypothetical protein
MDPIDQKRGEASVLWFRKTLVAPVNSGGVLDDELETAESIAVGPPDPEDVNADGRHREDDKKTL